MPKLILTRSSQSVGSFRMEAEQESKSPEHEEEVVEEEEEVRE